uniref:Uncharacterized protein n=1 Tax=Cannabis sativa TaxID=3483 RepID=A0A803QDL4_CANSA
MSWILPSSAAENEGTKVSTPSFPSDQDVYSRQNCKSRFQRRDRFADYPSISSSRKVKSTSLAIPSDDQLIISIVNIKLPSPIASNSGAGKYDSFLQMWQVEKLVTPENLWEDALRGDPDEVKETIAVIIVEEALKAVKADEKCYSTGLLGPNSSPIIVVHMYKCPSRPVVHSLVGLVPVVARLADHGVVPRLASHRAAQGWPTSS